MVKLGVNIDHVATIRQARKGREPEPISAAVICELAGADSIVAHLREDRRHINERDLKVLKEIVKTRLNLEMSINPEIVEIACKIKPDQVTLVPERREELTTEGGLDLVKNQDRLRSVIKQIKEKGIVVSLFIDPDKKQIEIAKKLEAEFIELHTGRYADSKTETEREDYLKEIIDSTSFAKSIGLRVNAGHGLNYHNVTSVAKIVGIEELNIGHAIISRAVFVGLENATREMIKLIRSAAPNLDF